jgi:hypothetical protein
MGGLRSALILTSLQFLAVPIASCKADPYNLIALHGATAQPRAQAAPDAGEGKPPGAALDESRRRAFTSQRKAVLMVEFTDEQKAAIRALIRDEMTGVPCLIRFSEDRQTITITVAPSLKEITPPAAQGQVG